MPQGGGRRGTGHGGESVGQSGPLSFWSSRNIRIETNPKFRSRPSKPVRRLRMLRPPHQVPPFDAIEMAIVPGSATRTASTSRLRRSSSALYWVQRIGFQVPLAMKDGRLSGCEHPGCGHSLIIVAATFMARRFYCAPGPKVMTFLPCCFDRSAI